jgi:hypothetical protein
VHDEEQIGKIARKEVKGDMAVLNFQTVRFVWSNYNSRNAHVWLDGIGAWRKIRPDNADAVTNILTLAAEARANNRQVDVEIDDSTSQINYITLR